MSSLLKDLPDEGLPAGPFHLWRYQALVCGNRQVALVRNWSSVREQETVCTLPELSVSEFRDASPSIDSFITVGGAEALRFAAKTIQPEKWL